MPSWPPGPLGRGMPLHTSEPWRPGTKTGWSLEKSTPARTTPDPCAANLARATNDTENTTSSVQRELITCLGSVFGAKLHLQRSPKHLHSPIQRGQATASCPTRAETLFRQCGGSQCPGHGSLERLRLAPVNPWLSY